MLVKEEEESNKH